MEDDQGTFYNCIPTLKYFEELEQQTKCFHFDKKNTQVKFILSENKNILE